MLTLRLPRDSLQRFLDYPGGLLALRSPPANERVLVIKGTKEMLLAAKLRKELKVYVVAITSLGDVTAGLVTAFFDDEDEPLFIASPLLAESESEDPRKAFLQSKLDVHFFDELGRELLGYRATLSMPPETRVAPEKMQLYPPTASLIHAMWRELPEFMATRTAEDDESAITVSLDEVLAPEDLFVMEARPYKNLFHGSPSVRHSSLVRAEPGRFREWDIIDLLHRTFKPTDIFHGPVKVTDGEEVADVIVATDTCGAGQRQPKHRANPQQQALQKAGHGAQEPCERTCPSTRSHSLPKECTASED